MTDPLHRCGWPRYWPQRSIHWRPSSSLDRNWWWHCCRWPRPRAHPARSNPYIPTPAHPGGHGLAEVYGHLVVWAGGHVRSDVRSVVDGLAQVSAERRPDGPHIEIVVTVRDTEHVGRGVVPAHHNDVQIARRLWLRKWNQHRLHIRRGWRRSRV